MEVEELKNYYYTINSECYEFLLNDKNNEYKICSACSGSGRYCGKIADCCDGLGYEKILKVNKNFNN